jgi:hypothetical protein
LSAQGRQVSGSRRAAIGRRAPALPAANATTPAVTLRLFGGIRRESGSTAGYIS